ncbi:MAG: hypothetical protein ACU0CT_02655 [Paracoccaceae bacterium]
MTDSTDNARGPDWEGFGRHLLECWPVCDMDGSDLFDAALRNGLIAEIPGGYDPEKHIDAEGICPEAGDPWYEYAFHPVRADPIIEPLADPRVVALVSAVREVAQDAYGYDDLYETTFHRDVHQKLSDALAALSPTGGNDG